MTPVTFFEATSMTLELSVVGSLSVTPHVLSHCRNCDIHVAGHDYNSIPITVHLLNRVPAASRVALYCEPQSIGLKRDVVTAVASDRPAYIYFSGSTSAEASLQAVNADMRIERAFDFIQLRGHYFEGIVEHSENCDFCGVLIGGNFVSKTKADRSRRSEGVLELFDYERANLEEMIADACIHGVSCCIGWIRD